MKKAIEKAIETLRSIEKATEPLYEGSQQQNNSTKSKTSQSFWPAGTGYGFGTALSSDVNFNSKLTLTLQSVDKYLSKLETQLLLIPTSIDDESLCSALSTIVTPLLELLFDNDSMLDIASVQNRYESSIEILIWCLKCDLTRNDIMTPTLSMKLNNTRKHHQMFKSISGSRLSAEWTLATRFDKLWEELKIEDSAEADIRTENMDISSPQPAPKKRRSTTRYDEFRPKVVTRAASTKAEYLAPPDPHQLYKDSFLDLQFGECLLEDHVFRAMNPNGVPSQLILRLSQEMACLASSLPLSPTGSIFIRFDSTRMYLLRALITGPAGTPYENGLFLFDIGIPEDYPAKPPSVRLLTTNGGTVRFNPNLYADGTVCLSLLSTWQGSPSEKWNPNTSTLFQLLVSIQSLVLNEEPYFNEPTYEERRGTAKGTQASQATNELLRTQTQKYAIQYWLAHKPTTDFDHLARLHLSHTKPSLPGIPLILDWMKQVAPAPK